MIPRWVPFRPAGFAERLGQCSCHGRQLYEAFALTFARVTVAMPAARFGGMITREAGWRSNSWRQGEWPGRRGVRSDSGSPFRRVRTAPGRGMTATVGGFGCADGANRGLYQ